MSRRQVLQPSAKQLITITPTARRVVVRIDGEVIADTQRALTLAEASYPVAQYIPLDDVTAEKLTRTETTTYLLPLQRRRRLLQRHHRLRHRRGRDLDLRAALRCRRRDRRARCLYPNKADITIAGD